MTGLAAELLPVPGEWIVQGGAVALLLLVALMVFRGQLVPRSIYQEKVKECDHWREVALKAIGQNETLLPAAQITTQVVKELGDVTAAAVERALGGKAR